MASSMLAGERRWASARRGGMTVLGKVAVPKPINLPSQRLENHGLDPNVEIVPKGTLSWGSRPSSSASNAWGGSSLSPNTDGGSNSPGHLSGRPSSGGSGTRPSTAGSDGTQEPSGNAWGSNSRPSSASGTFPSTQTSLRPRSADTRPNSSQLSRFAEPVSENLVGWGPSSTAERLGVKSSKDDGFSLSSGDFPTLGSERENTVKNNESQGHSSSRPSSASGRLVEDKVRTTTAHADHSSGRPGSASGRIAWEKEKNTTSGADINSGIVNTWKSDSHQSADHGINPSMDMRQREPQQYFNSSIHPQHFDPWNGPFVNAPARGPPGGPPVWYRGPPGGPPFRAPVPPSGFPMEPFRYFPPPQFPPPPLRSSQQVSPPASGPRGPHNKNGDFYRPQMPDTHAHPRMPFRPGFYPGPVPFEGYYRPPMGYSNASERELAYEPSQVHNNHPAQVDPARNSLNRAGGRDSISKTSEAAQLEHHTRQPLGVPLKNNNQWVGEDEGQNIEQSKPSNSTYTQGGGLPDISFRTKEWGAPQNVEEDMFAKDTIPSQDRFERTDYHGRSSEVVREKSLKDMRNVGTGNEDGIGKRGIAEPVPLEIRQSSPAGVNQSSLPTMTKDTALVRKTEGLHEKAWASGRRYDASHAYNREGQGTFQFNDHKTNNYRNILQNPDSGDLVPLPQEDVAPATHPTAVMPRRPLHGEGRIDHRGKEKYNSRDNGWRKPPNADFSDVIAAPSVESASNNHSHIPNFAVEVAKNPVNDPADSSTDIKQMKLSESAKQRALRLQQEENERIKEQKAKAFAKLEELNRRARAVENVAKEERTQAVQVELTATNVSLPVVQEPIPSLVSDAGLVSQDRDKNVRDETVEKDQSGSAVSHDKPLLTRQDAHNMNPRKVPYRSNDGTISRHKGTGYKQMQNNSLQKNLNEGSVSDISWEAPKEPTSLPNDAVSSTNTGWNDDGPGGQSDSLNTTDITSNSSSQPRRKSNRNSKNRRIPDESPSVPALPSVTPSSNLAKESTEKAESNVPLFVSECPVSDEAVVSQDVVPGSPNQEGPGKVRNHWKPQGSHKMSRSQQSNRFADKSHGNETVKWAPVRAQNKDEAALEVSQKSNPESAAPIKSESTVQSVSRTKRAEMERYIPKPVAKELAQQESIQPSSSVNTSVSNETTKGTLTGPASSASNLANAMAGHGAELEGDGKHNKQVKAHGTWRQRSSKEPHHASHSTSGLGKDVETTGPAASVEGEISSAESKTSNEINASKANCAGEIMQKDLRSTGGRKSHQPRGYRNMGNNHNPDNRDFVSGETERGSIVSAASDMDQTERMMASQETQSPVERNSSHWRPKSPANSVNNQPRNGASGSETMDREHNRVGKKDQPPQREAHSPSRGYKGRSEVEQPLKQSMAGEEKIGHHHQSRRERRSGPGKYRPDQVPIDEWESAPVTNAASDFGRKGHPNNRPYRGHGSHGDGLSGQDHRQHHVPTYKERHGQNVNYEYQPVGSRKTGTSDGSYDAKPRYKDRGQNQLRRGRGNYQSRPHGPFVDSNY